MSWGAALLPAAPDGTRIWASGQPPLPTTPSWSTSAWTPHPLAVFPKPHLLLTCHTSPPPCRPEKRSPLAPPCCCCVLGTPSPARRLRPHSLRPGPAASGLCPQLYTESPAPEPNSPQPRHRLCGDPLGPQPQCPGATCCAHWLCRQLLSLHRPHGLCLASLGGPCGHSPHNPCLSAILSGQPLGHLPSPPDVCQASLWWGSGVLGFKDLGWDWGSGAATATSPFEGCPGGSGEAGRTLSLPVPQVPHLQTLRSQAPGKGGPESPNPGPGCQAAPARGHITQILGFQNVP